MSETTEVLLATTPPGGRIPPSFKPHNPLDSRGPSSTTFSGFFEVIMEIRNTSGVDLAGSIRAISDHHTKLELLKDVEVPLRRSERRLILFSLSPAHTFRVQWAFSWDFHAAGGFDDSPLLHFVFHIHRPKPGKPAPTPTPPLPGPPEVPMAPDDVHGETFTNEPEAPKPHVYREFYEPPDFWD